MHTIASTNTIFICGEDALLKSQWRNCDINYIPLHSLVAFLYVAPLFTYTSCIPNTKYACADN